VAIDVSACVDLQEKVRFIGRGSHDQSIVILTETHYCPVWAMLKGSTTITTAIDVVETGSHV
jgi:uncharacterized OsmC-like protein